MRVIPESLLKRRTFANGGVDQVRAFRLDGREYVCLIRERQLLWGIGKFAQYRLTADHDKIVDIRDGSGRADNVLQLDARHGFSLANSS